MGKKVLLCLFLVRFQSNVEDGLEVARRCGCRWRWSLRHSETGMDWSRARREGREEKRRPWREREKVDRVLPWEPAPAQPPYQGNQTPATGWRLSGTAAQTSVKLCQCGVVLKLAQVAPFSLQSTRVTMTLRSL